MHLGFLGTGGETDLDEEQTGAVERIEEERRRAISEAEYKTRPKEVDCERHNSPSFENHVWEIHSEVFQGLRQEQQRNHYLKA
jgi:hypothetical protein